MAMLFLSHRPPRGLLRFFWWPAMHVNWLVRCHPHLACKHRLMNLCPSAGGSVSKARRPTRRLIGGFARQFNVMPGTSASTYQWRFRDGFDDDPENFTRSLYPSQDRISRFGNHPHGGVVSFPVIRNRAPRLMAEKVVNWTGAV